MQLMLGTEIGAATVFSLLLDKERAVRAVLDEDAAASEWYGCSDGTTTGYLKIKTERIIQDFLPYAEHAPAIIRI